MSNKQYWVLVIRNRDLKQRKVCATAWGDTKSGVMLDFVDYIHTNGLPFDSEKQAWWHWYQFRKFHPNDCVGWYASVVPYKKEGGCAPGKEDTATPNIVVP